MEHSFDDQQQPSRASRAEPVHRFWSKEILAALQALCGASGARLAALSFEDVGADLAVDAFGRESVLEVDLREAASRHCASSESLVVAQSSGASQEGFTDVTHHAAIRLPGDAAAAAGLLIVVGVSRDFGTPANAIWMAGYATVVGALLHQHRDLQSQVDVIVDQGRALAHQRKIFERSSEVAKIGVWECDLARETLAWTDGIYDMFELPRGSAISRQKTLQFYEPESASEMTRLRSAAIQDRTGFKMDARIVTANGKRRWMRLTATVESENGRAVRIFGMKQDITEEKALADRTRYLAECDVLTGLANRSCFQAALADLAGAEHATLLLVDLDGFKQINDTFGHAMGDECLKQIAARLREVCVDADLVSRVGGDEFAILTRACLGRAQVDTLAERIVHSMRQPICWSNQSFQLGASVGVAFFKDEAGLDTGELFSRADMALYAAKGAGKNSFRVFEPVMKLASDLRIATVKNIGRALDLDQLDLHYQPKISLVDGSLMGFEALLRWRLQDNRHLAASAFSAAFEDPELSRRIGCFVVQRALAQARSWREQGASFGHIAINLCARQLQDPRFTVDLLQQISAHGLQPCMFEIEITEGVLLTDETGPAYRQMRLLREMGLRVAIDDFGTGYASLVHLRDFPVDTIKIDKSFVQRFLHAPADASILEAILQLGLRLGKTVVAEGVETKEQFERLRALGCTSAQGFYISKAVAPEDAAPFFETSAVRFGRVA